MKSYQKKWHINPAQVDNLFEGVQSVARRFILENFREQGFKDGGLKAWQKKKKPDGRAVLTGKSSPHMRQSFQFSRGSKQSVKIYNSKPYSGYHNEGTNKLAERRMIGKSKTLDSMISKDIQRRMKKVFK